MYFRFYPVLIIFLGGGDAEIYRNRKNFFSINVQGVVDADYNFLNIVARWPGSTHDVTIFNNSLLRMQFERNDFPNCRMLGKYTKYYTFRWYYNLIF